MRTSRTCPKIIWFLIWDTLIWNSSQGSLTVVWNFQENFPCGGHTRQFGPWKKFANFSLHILAQFWPQSLPRRFSAQNHLQLLAGGWTQPTRSVKQKKSRALLSQLSSFFLFLQNRSFFPQIRPFNCFRSEILFPLFLLFELFDILRKWFNSLSQTLSHHNNLYVQPIAILVHILIFVNSSRFVFLKSGKRYWNSKIYVPKIGVKFVNFVE